MNKSQDTKLTPHFFTGIAFAAFGLTKFGFNLILQWKLGSETVGHYNLVISSAAIIPLIISPLFGVATSKFASEARGKENAKEFDFVVGLNFWLSTIFSLAAASGFLLFIPSISSHFSTNPSLFYWGPAIILLTTIHLFFKRLFFVLDQIRLYALLEFTTSIIFFLTLYACISSGFHDLLLLPLVLQLGLFSVVSILIYYKHVMHLSWFKEWKHYRDKLPGFFKYSMITGIGTALSVASLHLFTLVLGGVADIRSVGYFSVVRSTVEPANYLFRIITMVNFPKIAFLYGKGDINRLKEFMRNTIKKFMGLISLAFIPAILLSPVIAGVLFGSHRGTGQTLLLALLLGMYFLRTLSVFYVNFLSATRYTHIPNLAGPLAVLSIIPFIPVVFSNYGLGGLGMLILSGEIIRFSVVTVLGRQKLKKMV